jgi:DNA-binding LacI/PurR family transcriptional regulator
MSGEHSSLKAGGSKQSEIVAALRRQIVAGRQEPGSRLPTWDELGRKFSVSRPTLRLALGELKAQGFIEPDSTRGTFVARRPPCLHRYGLVFFESPGTARWNRLYAALAQQASVLSQTGERKLEVFCNVTVSEACETRRQIMQDVENHCFAGLIMVGAVALMQDARWQSMKVPRVAICKPRDASLSALSSVGLDWSSFWQKSLDWLASRGRRRIAVLAIDYHPQAGLCELARQRGLVAKPSWHHVGSLQYPEAAGHITQLLMDPSLGDRPDAIIITDDNLVEPAVGGLMAAGVRVGEELDVVAHCCWPWPVPIMPQIKRLGFDANELLTTALNSLDAQRSSRREARQDCLPARFENEVSQGAHSSTNTI